MKLFTTKPSGGNALVSFRHNRLALWRRFEWIHARRGGGPVLRGESSWRIACGFVIHHKTRHLLVQFRRFRAFT